MINNINYTAITMPSVTHALKAKTLFSQNGFECTVKRLSGSTRKGCTHYILINTDTQTAVSFLKKFGVKYGEILPKAVGT